MSYSAIYRGATAINEAMGRVYFYMMTAVLNSFVVSYLVSHNKALMALSALRLGSEANHLMRDCAAAKAG